MSPYVSNKNFRASSKIASPTMKPQPGRSVSSSSASDQPKVVRCSRGKLQSLLRWFYDSTKAVGSFLHPLTPRMAEKSSKYLDVKSVSHTDRSVDGPSRLHSMTTFTSALSSEQTNTIRNPPLFFSENLSNNPGGSTPFDSVGNDFSTEAHNKALPPSSTLHSRPKTPTTISTKIDEQEFLDLADFVYRNSIPTLDNPQPRLNETDRYLDSELPDISPTRFDNGNNVGQVEEDHSFNIAAVDLPCESSAAGPQQFLLDHHSIKSNQTIHEQRARHTRTQRSQDTLEGWVEYKSDTQSLRTISGRPTLHIRSRSRSSLASDFEAIDVGEAYLFSDILNPTAIGMGFSFGSTSQPRRVSQNSRPCTPTLGGTPAATWRIDGACEGTWKTLVDQKAFSRSKAQLRGNKRRRSLGVLTSPQSIPMLQPRSTRRSSISSSLIPCHSIALEIQYPSSSKSSVFETALSDLDYDYVLALEVLVLGSAKHNLPENTLDHNFTHHSFDILPEMDILPPSTDPDKTSLTTFDTEIVFRRRSRVSSNLQLRCSDRTPSSGTAFPTVALPEHTSVHNPQTELVKQKRSFFSHVTHIFART